MTHDLTTFVTGVSKATAAMSQEVVSAYCQRCYSLDAYISSFESYLASGQDLGLRFPENSKVPIGLRSEIENRAETCPGCRSILEALEFHLPTDFKIKYEQFVLSNDYELTLEIKPKDVAYAYSSPISITTWGIEVRYSRQMILCLPILSCTW